MTRPQTITPARTARSRSPGLYAVSVHRTGCVDHFITSTPLEGESMQDVFERAAGAVAEAGGTVVSQDVLGLPFENGRGQDLLEEAFGPVAWPVTWLEALGDGGAGAGGTYLWAVTGPSVTPLRQRGTVVGTRVSDPVGDICRLAGLMPEDTTAPPSRQATSIVNSMSSALQDAGMTFGHTVRTWFYNQEILSWYDDFNGARNRFFKENGVFDGLVPASTGVGSGITRGAALTGGLLAIKPQAQEVTSMAVPSPLQCPALDYGSSFNRAVELGFPDHRRLLISGTASIAPEGNTIHVGSIDGQIRQTSDVVEAILESRGMGWDAVTRFLAYVKNAEDVPKFMNYCEETEFGDLPVVTIVADICRDDLLFEFEVDAILPEARETDNGADS